MVNAELIYPIPSYRVNLFLTAMMLFFILFVSIGLYYLWDGSKGSGAALLLFGLVTAYWVFRLLRRKKHLWQLKIHDDYILCRPFNISYSTRGGGVSLLRMYFTDKVKKIHYDTIKNIALIDSSFGGHYIRLLLDTGGVFNLPFIPHDRQDLAELYNRLDKKIYEIYKVNDFAHFEEEYLRDLIEVPLSIPDLFADKSRKPYLSEQYTCSLLDEGGSRYREDINNLFYAILYDEISQKYFKLVIADGFDYYAFAYFFAISAKMIYGLINKQEYADAQKGTAQNPYLLLGVKGWDKPLLHKDTLSGAEKNIDFSKEHVRYNAYRYFTYVMPKTDFAEYFRTLQH